MKQNYLYLLVLLSTGLCSTQRNILVLLDQHGNTENIGRPIWRFLNNRLQTALEEQACPILINANLWGAFIEKRLSIEQMGAVEETPESRTLNLYKRLNTRLNYWYEYYREKGINPIQAKQFMLDAVNNEAYNPHQLVQAKKDGSESVLSWPQQITLASYITHFNKNDWQVYTNQKGFYLLIPTKIIEQNSKQELDYAFTPEITKNEAVLGLKVDHLTRIDDYDNAARCFIDAQCDEFDKFTEQLSDFFVTNSSSASGVLPYSWNFFFAGHGGWRWDFANETIDKIPTDTIIADLKGREFLQLLDFLQNSISTNCLLFSTCYGGGNRLKLLFDDNSSIYNFAIVSTCLSDAFDYCFWDSFNFPSYEGQKLLETDIQYDAEKKWYITYNHGYQWHKAIKSLSRETFENDLSWLHKTLDYIRTDRLCSTSLIRLPESTQFIPVISTETILLNNHRINEDDNPIVISKETTTILLENSVIPPLVVENKNIEMPHFVSLKSGAAKHYFEKISVQNFYGIGNAFWPLEGDRYIRLFLIQELECPTNQNHIMKTFGIKGETTTFKNILIRAQHGLLLRIFLQLEDDRCFMLIFNKEDDFDIDAKLKGIHELNPESCVAYLQFYTAWKEKVIGIEA